MSESIPEPKASATVVLLRDHNQQLEVLMLQKSHKINYGGSWVFPGGVTDPEDYQCATGDEQISVAKITAARETHEEAGLTIQASSLLPFAHWTTPKLKIKRYATWFLLADANQIEQETVIDQGEIVEAKWLSPSNALTAQAEGSFALNGPSYVTLTELLNYSDTQQALHAYQQRGPVFYEPRGVKISSGIATLYHDDALYSAEHPVDEAMLEQGGQQHRLYMPQSGPWRYIKT